MPATRRWLPVTALVALSVIAACGRERTPSAEPPLPVSAAEFSRLRWLEGTWRGTGDGVGAFYEGYRWLDDSTIGKVDFADSTLSTQGDRGQIALRNGTVRSGSEARHYVLVALDSTSARFAPGPGTSNGFEWRRTSDSSWSARLTWDSAGVARERTYEMRAYRPNNP